MGKTVPFGGLERLGFEEHVLGKLPDSEMKCISILQELAFEEPSERDTIVRKLEGYAYGKRGRAGTAAFRAAANIIAVSMMEVLHEM